MILILLCVPSLGHLSDIDDPFCCDQDRWHADVSNTPMTDPSGGPTVKACIYHVQFSVVPFFFEVI